METHKFDGGEFSVIQDNVLLIEFDSGKLITKHHLNEQKKMRQKCLGNRQYHSITDAREGLINLSDEAKAYLAEENQSSRARLSDAVLVNSFAKKIEVELYIRLHKPKVKTKVFTDLNNALCWIEQQEKKTVELV